MGNVYTLKYISNYRIIVRSIKTNTMDVAFFSFAESGLLQYSLSIRKHKMLLLRQENTSKP